jgi:hypothetical protein
MVILVARTVVGLPCAAIVLDRIEQAGDVVPADRSELAIPPLRQDMNVEQPLDLIARAQALIFDVALWSERWPPLSEILVLLRQGGH